MHDREYENRECAINYTHHFCQFKRHPEPLIFTYRAKREVQHAAYSALNRFLALNVSKTKDMCIDFRCSHPSPDSSVIDCENTEIMESYKYLELILDMTSESNTDTVQKSVSFVSGNSPSSRLTGP